MDLLLESTLLIAFFILYPLYGWLGSSRDKKALSEGRISRIRIFGEVLVVQWMATALLAILWWTTGRDAEALGLGWSGSSRAWLAVLLVGLAMAVMVVQVLMFQNNADFRRKTLVQFESADAIMPQDQRELRWFSAVAVTAGICEELLYRGFLLWWLGTEMGLGTGRAAVVVTVVFGLGHAYLGWGGILKAGLVGGLMMGLRLLAGSIWPVVVLHTVMDLGAGYMMFSARRLQALDEREDLENSTVAPEAQNAAAGP